MHYFAGLFDAEGYVSLAPNGAFTIAMEISDEATPILFKENFGGSIYSRKRENRKNTWTWKINSISEQALYFINSISDKSVVKKNQLQRLKDYLDQSREDRKHTRSITCSTIKAFKIPTLELKHILPLVDKPIEPHFFEWLAGFIDGDGNFVCNEYLDNRNKKKYFSYQISAANTFAEVICHINDRIPGTITQMTGSSHPVFKWVPSRVKTQIVCEYILPFLKIKKGQCDLLLEFTSTIDRTKRYDIINQIKHLNSL